MHSISIKTLLFIEITLCIFTRNILEMFGTRDYVKYAHLIDTTLLMETARV